MFRDLYGDPMRVVAAGQDAAEASLDFVRTGVALTCDRLALPSTHDEMVLARIGEFLGWDLVFPKRGLGRYRMKENPPEGVLHLAEGLVDLDRVIEGYPIEFVGDALVVHALREDARRQGIHTNINPEYERFLAQLEEAERPVASDVSKLNGGLSRLPVEDFSRDPRWLIPGADIEHRYAA